MLQSDQFQEDLYPDTIGTCPALSARDWISGMNSPPILISLKTGLMFLNIGYVAIKFCRKIMLNVYHEIYF